MKVIISSTYDNKYLYYLPITTWCWNKLNVDVICFAPRIKEDIPPQLMLIDKVQREQGLRLKNYFFNAPEHKQATYAQCSRLYGACLDLPLDEILITSDVDMGVLNFPSSIKNAVTGEIDMPYMEVIGADLVPDGQYPMCYLKASVGVWRKTMGINGKSYQECLDEILGHEEMENMRGNLWSRDQEIAFNKINASIYPCIKTNRAKEGTQFATKRYDRDDSYILDRLNPDTIDFHMNRPGYLPENLEIILKVLDFHYPNESFEWLKKYTNEYKQLL